MIATLAYLPFFLLAGTFSLAIVIGLGTGSLATGGRGRRGRFHWHRHQPPPLPDPTLGPNPRAVPLVEAPDGRRRQARRLRTGPPPADPELPPTEPAAPPG